MNKVVFVGAFPSSAQVLMAFQLPNGIWTVPQMLSRTAELEGVTTKDGKAYSGWVGLIGATPQIDDNGAIIKDEGGNTLYNLDFSVTENYGTCMVQFYVYAASHAVQFNIDGKFVLRNVTGGLLATANSSFEIERGVPAIIPDLSEDDNQVLLTQILNALSNTQGNVDDLHNNAVVDISLTLNGKMLDIVGKNTFDEDAAGNEVELPFVKTDGDTMTGALEIDEGGVKTSYGAGGITNNGNPITLPQKSGVIALIQDVLDAVSDKMGITFEVVEELPQENAKTNAIYLVPSGENAPNVYDEFIFINNAWEKIGTTAIDLSNYPTNDAVVEVAQMLFDLIPKNIVDGSSNPGAVQQIADPGKVNEEGYFNFATNDEGEEVNPNALKFAASLRNLQKNGAVGKYSAAFGGVSSAQGSRSFAINSRAIAKGDESFASGYYTAALGGSSSVMGVKTTAVAEAAHAEGALTVAEGKHTHAEGAETLAKGNNSHSEGYKSEAIGENSHAEGSLTNADGLSAHAEGHETSTSKEYAHAEGAFTKANGVAAHAEGTWSEANGEASHAEGASSKANAVASHAGGNGTRISEGASYSFGHGQGLRVNHPNQTVVGRYNNNILGNLFEIGNGESNDKRSNAFEVTADGRAKGYGVPTDLNDFVRVNELNAKLNADISSSALPKAYIKQVNGTQSSMEILDSPNVDGHTYGIPSTNYIPAYINAVAQELLEEVESAIESATRKHHIYLNSGETLHIWTTIKSNGAYPFSSIDDLVGALAYAGHIDIGSALMCTGAIEGVPVSAMYTHDGTNITLCIISPDTPGGIETVELTEVDNVVDTIN